jgi:hypothetical protein
VGEEEAVSRPRRTQSLCLSPESRRIRFELGRAYNLTSHAIISLKRFLSGLVLTPISAMRLPCAAQLHPSQLRCAYGVGHVHLRCARMSLLVPRAKNNNQKNEGVYFEYEAVDPDAAEELLALEGLSGSRCGAVSSLPS